MDGASAELRAAADELEARLRAVGRPERAEHDRVYLRSDLDFLGASVPQVRAASRRLHAEHADLDHDGLVGLVEELWSRGIHDCRVAAVELLDRAVELLTPADLDLLERLVRESRTWALVDGLATKVVGGLLEQHPDAWAVVDRWVVDADFWVRRAVLLAQLVPLRRGEGDFDRFARHADALLDEREFFIRKAIGWVLREVGRTRPALVAGWLAPRTHRASGVTVREATKHLPEPQREALLAGYRRGEPARVPPLPA